MIDTGAKIVELFSSVQGEGLMVGLRQIFLRFHGCNLGCAYCDTGQDTPPRFCQIEGAPGRRDFHPAENPLTLDRVLCLLDGWQKGWPGLHHSLSLTGGEPLLNHELLQQWLPEIRRFLPIYLETNGILHSALALLINHIDYVSMDFKLPSTARSGHHWDCHLDFLRVAAAREVFVKAVIADETEEWEILRSCEIIAAVDRAIPLILQPVTASDGTIPVSAHKMLELQELACGFLREVRVIPQTHRFMGQL